MTDDQAKELKRLIVEMQVNAIDMNNHGTYPQWLDASEAVDRFINSLVDQED